MDDRYVELDSLEGHHLADLLKSYLEANGIPAQISQESYGATVGLTVGALGAAKVLVPESRLEEARRLLTEYYERGEDEAPEGA
jgi:hypothetical protein